MKYRLIKLSDTHYIVVDDSEIKGGISEYYLDKNTMKIYSSGGAEYGEKQLVITHSTQPLEQYYGATDGTIPFVYHKIKQLSLSEVEEAIYGYSVEKLNPCTGEDFRIEWENGFKAHQELVKDKYDSVLPMLFDLRNILKKCESTSVGQTYINIKIIQLNQLIQTLLPKTEWDIEFDEQGKIRLK